MNSSSSTSQPKFPGTAAHPVAGFAETNKSFISKFKKDNKVTVQTKLPSRVELDNANAVSEGYTVTDAIWWRRFVEEFKYSPLVYIESMQLLCEMALKCKCHPVGLVHFGRTTYGFKQFGDAEVEVLHANMLDYVDSDLEEGEYEETSRAQRQSDVGRGVRDRRRQAELGQRQEASSADCCGGSLSG